MAQPAGQSPRRTSQRLATATQSVSANTSAMLVPLNGNQPLAVGNQNQNPNILINLQPNVNVKVDGTGLDTFIPVIPKVQTEDIKELFKVKYLTPISMAHPPTTG